MNTKCTSSDFYPFALFSLSLAVLFLSLSPSYSTSPFCAGSPRPPQACDYRYVCMEEGSSTRGFILGGYIGAQDPCGYGPNIYELDTKSGVKDINFNNLRKAVVFEHVKEPRNVQMDVLSSVESYMAMVEKHNQSILNGTAALLEKQKNEEAAAQIAGVCVVCVKKWDVMCAFVWFFFSWFLIFSFVCHRTANVNST